MKEMKCQLKSSTLRIIISNIQYANNYRVFRDTVYVYRLLYSYSLIS